MSFNLALGQVAAAIGLGVLLFLGTNIDDVFILLALFSNSSFSPAQVVAGQMVGMALVIALSIAGALAALVIAPQYVGLLGLVPLGLGILHLVRRRDDDDDAEAAAGMSGRLQVLAVAAITVANGGDNIGVYIPVFATAGRLHIAIYAATILVLTAGSCWLAQALIRQPRLGTAIRRFAEPAMPYILIALGAYILIESRSYAIFVS